MSLRISSVFIPLFFGQLVFAWPATAQCSPVACSQILVELPHQLNFGQDHGQIDDKNGVGTGFTYIDPPASGSGYQPANLLVNLSSGLFKITTTSGLAYLNSNSQVNTLGVGIDAPSQLSIINTTLVNPPAGSGKYEQAGLWFGNDQDNYVKLVVISTPGGTLLQYLMEVNGALKSSVSSSPKTLTSSKVGLQLRVDPASRTIAASYTINGNASVALGSFPAPTGFFSFDAAGIDPEIGTNSFGGIFASHRQATKVLTYSFDNFSVVAEHTTPPPGDFDFSRTTFSVADSPTSMVWGPDNRLYVAGVSGKIQAFTLNSLKQPTNTQTINSLVNSLGNRLLLGITVDPASTASNVILWVSHSSGSLNAGEANSGMVSRLSGSNFSTVQHVITGLPRALANHGPNSLHFGPDGKLYISIGGNTGAGAPNTANTEFGTRAEQPLSAAVLVADVKNSSFDGSCANTSNIYGTPPCSVKTYATGLRNAYDFVFHSNGNLYATDNGLGVEGTFPPKPTPPCTGYGDIAPVSSGGDNPGDQPDLLLLLKQGKYYGHPDPYRNQCVFKDGSYQNVPPLSNWEPPLLELGFNHSANGLIEYTSGAFCSAIKGNLLATNYSVGDDITRHQLSTDGESVLASSSLISGFDDPLSLTQGPDGTIYVAEFGANRVAALVPSSTTSTTGSWESVMPLPVAILDAGSAALNGKLYVVGGKTSSDHITTMHIYNPLTDSWTTGPNMPGSGVENPAAVALNGKLYVFGGSTAAFSGAVTSARVFNPQNSTWSTLAPMKTGRSGATAITLNGKIYVAGGLGSNGASLSSVEVYTVSTNSWATLASMATARDNLGGAALMGKLYIFGGRTRTSSGVEVSPTLTTVEAYNPSTNTWSYAAPMPTGRRAMSVGLLNGRAQLMGGERTSNGGAFAQNEEYNPSNNTWRTLQPMSPPRHGTAVGTIDGVVYVAGGGTTGGSSFTSITEAFSLDSSCTSS